MVLVQTRKGVSHSVVPMVRPTHQSIVSIVSRKVHRGAYSPCDVICSDHAAPEHKQGEEQVADTSCLSCVGHAASAVSALQVHNADMVPSPLHDASRMVWL